MNIFQKLTIHLITCCMFFGCSEYYSSFFIREGEAFAKEEVEIVVEPTRQWTIMLYMAADNNLESEAIRDINELESFNLYDKGISIIALLDRYEGYDGTNGDWTDTRLLEITQDTGGDNGVLVSKELTSKELALSEGVPTELDMSSSNTLKNFLQFGYTHFQAENYALFIWGHGGGWRSVISDNFTNSTMSLPNLRTAIEEGIDSHELDILAFDASFGATIEMLWETKDLATWFIGMPGSISLNGWSYKNLFSHFLESSLTVNDFLSASEATHRGNTIINLSYVEGIKESFDVLTKSIANQIDTREKQIELKQRIFSDVLDYEVSSHPADMYIDMLDFSTVISENVGLFSNDIDIESTILHSCSNLKESFKKAQYTDMSIAAVSVFFISLISDGIPNSVFPSAYIQDSEAINNIMFVRESTGWVPTKNKTGTLLDKLFFENF